MFDINTYFDNIYCLNLDSRKDRWQKMEAKFKILGIGAQRFSAIDGNSIDDSEFEKIMVKANPEGLVGRDRDVKGVFGNKFALGCLLSHLKIYNDAKEKGFKRILILEDDVLFAEDFSERIQKIQDLKWKMIYLGATQYDWSVRMNGGFYEAKHSLGTFGYAVDSSFYDFLINSLGEKLKTVDNALAKLQTPDILVFFPNLVVADVTDSDIRGSRNQEEHSVKMKWNLKKYW